ncbi:MAG: hypothetical protein HY318_11715 [Armatimonadetes bacterium]|nr:hypothetical protein [Armatimonadota bacterium]
MLVDSDTCPEWGADPDSDTLEWLQNHPLRKDTVVFLEYLRAHRPVGTQNRGNLPLKAVREISSRFVDPPPMEEIVGEKVYRVRNEEEVRRLVFIHELAFAQVLAGGGRCRQWRLTTEGEEFLELSPSLQLQMLFFAWWLSYNWRHHYPWENLEESLPLTLKPITLDRLVHLPVEESVPFEEFADRLIADTGLVWLAEKQTYAQMYLRSAVQHMVIQPLADFLAIELEYREELVGTGTYETLHGFRTTAPGRWLLNNFALSLQPEPEAPPPPRSIVLEGVLGHA